MEREKMAKLVVVAVSDRAIGAYMNPFCAPTVGAAVRAFGDEVNREGSELGKHPHDYELHKLASFDTESGSFQDVAVEVIARASMLVVRAVDPRQMSLNSAVLNAGLDEVAKGNGGAHVS